MHHELVTKTFTTQNQALAWQPQSHA